MNAFISIYKKNKVIKFYIDLIIVFILPQIIIGLLFSGISFDFSSKLNFDIYLYLRNLIIISLYVYSFIKIFNDISNFSKSVYKSLCIFLWFYIIISIFLTNFYNGTPYTIISYLANRYENIFQFPSINDPLYQSLKYVITGNFFY